MAIRYTKNLRLRIEDSLSAASIYNLQRLDELGATFVVDTSDDLVVSSREGIIFRPSNDGKVGTKGIISLGIQGDTASRVDIWSEETYLNGELMPAASDILTGTDLAGKEDYLNLPTGDGQILKSNTDGTRYWDTLSGTVASKNIAVNWEPVDGATFSNTHGYNTTDIEISIYDPNTATYIAPESVDISDPNTVILQVIEAPTNTWKVFIREVFS